VDLGVPGHFNYVGDLLISLAMCMTMGSPVAVFHIIYKDDSVDVRINRIMTGALGSAGKYWEQTKEVPYALILYVSMWLVVK
jgi:7-dehydrocholesterol reductase